MFLKSNNNVTEFAFEESRLIDQHADVLMGCLVIYRQLRVLSLSHDEIDDSAFSKICVYLKGMRELQKLDISYNDVTDNSLGVILSIMINKDTILKSMNISHNKIKNIQTIMEFKYKMEIINKND